MKHSELKQKSPQELQEIFEALDKELFDLKNELKVSRKLEKPHLIKENKRTRARILTLLNETKANVG